MKPIKKESLKIADGSYEHVKNTTLKINIGGKEVDISLDGLNSIEDFKEDTIKTISNLFKLKITSFDDIKIYHGSRKGLKLHYQWIDDTLLSIFSFGEYQPGRFICIFEGVLQK